MHTPVFRRSARLRFSEPQWRELTSELARRGLGARESGAFLLAATNSHPSRVTRVVYYDDLDPDCLQGSIVFSGFGFQTLWDICVDEGFRLIGDVHTHSGTGVAQSPTDREHPMYPRVGHVALILPNLAQGRIRASQVGVHEYFGDDGWRSHFNRGARRLLYIGRWP